MKDFLIREYVNRITLEDIKKFALTQGINLTEDEQNIIYTYVKKYYYTFIYGNPRTYLDELKTKVSSVTYSKIESLYTQFKEKISR